jgi:hypothetical protein
MEDRSTTFSLVLLPFTTMAIDVTATYRRAAH